MTLDPGGEPIEVYKAGRLVVVHQVVAGLVLTYFIGFAVFSSGDSMDGGQRALVIVLGVVLAAAILRGARRRIEVWSSGAKVCNYLTTFEVRWEDLAGVRVIPAGLELQTNDGRRLMASVVARWNWRPYLGGTPSADEIAARLAARADAARGAPR